ncbi:DUF3098 domain-containing protein [Desertivirga brevis]|uniref:DUF3098 domain-containing protein n=1 Tax=Desertivirga brevis TaxID=2810310 RepID=UPI001A97A5A0|nr:DUF3098 domain-containing protein [Pedobacter sp. SYSU D00873]
MALKKTTSTNTPVEFVFGKSNYRLMLVSIAVIALGFILMIGETDIYDFRKTVIAPFVVLVGFGIGFYSILKKREN